MTVMLANKPIVMLGIPTIGQHSHFFTQSLGAVSMPTNFSMQVRWLPGREVGEARNLLVHEARKIGAKYLWFIDEDVIGPAEGLRRLMYFLDTHEDWFCVGGVYATKGIPPEPLLYKDFYGGPYYGWKQGELIQVAAIGNGYTMYRVEDFSRIESTQYEERDPFDNNNHIWVDNYFNTGAVESIGTDGGVRKTVWTEDMYLFWGAQQAGLKVYCDTGMELLHYHSGMKTFFKVPINTGTCEKPDPFNKRPCIIELGCGLDIDPNVVNADLRDDPFIQYRVDITQMPQDWAEHFDVARAHHVLEHFSHTRTLDVLKEWYRILRPGGLLQIIVPDLESVGAELARGNLNKLLMGSLYGDQGDPYWQQQPYGGMIDGKYKKSSYENNAHKAGFTRQFLGNLMAEVGFDDLRYAQADYQIVVIGHKPGNDAILPTAPTDDKPEVIQAVEVKTDEGQPDTIRNPVEPENTDSGGRDRREDTPSQPEKRNRKRH